MKITGRLLPLLFALGCASKSEPPQKTRSIATSLPGTSQKTQPERPKPPRDTPKQQITNPVVVQPPSPRWALVKASVAKAAMRRISEAVGSKPDGERLAPFVDRVEGLFLGQSGSDLAGAGADRGRVKHLNGATLDARLGELAEVVSQLERLECQESLCSDREAGMEVSFAVRERGGRVYLVGILEVDTESTDDRNWGTTDQVKAWHTMIIRRFGARK